MFQGRELVELMNSGGGQIPHEIPTSSPNQKRIRAWKTKYHEAKT
jgi:hypothetical protein